MAVYIVGDVRLLESPERDAQIIKRWNEEITNEDLTILLGEKVVAEKSIVEVADIMKKLNGEKKVIDIESTSPDSKKWEEITGRKTFLVNGAIPGKIDGEDEVILLLTSMKGFTKEKRNSYCTTARTISHQNKLYEDKVLSISWDDWGGPVNYMDVGRMIDDQILFERMEEKNNEG